MAGFLQFDPDNWEPERASNDDEGAAKVAKAAKAEPTLATLAGLAGLPPDLEDGLARLSQMATPRGVRAEPWTGVVADALRIASEGWAERALGLGWNALDLFGAVAASSGDPDCDGLAVKLAGRRLLAISDSFATVEEGQGRAFLYRHGNDGARLLWELGRGR